MNKRRRAYKKYDWKAHFKRVALWNYYSDVAKHKVKPTFTNGKIYIFRKTVRIGNEDLTMTVSAIDKLHFQKELEKRILYGI